MTAPVATASGGNGPVADRAVIACRQVSVELNDAVILDGVDLELRPGEWLGLIGPNGAGKTTLLNAIAGLVPHQGLITAGDGGRPGPLDLALVAQNPVVPPGMTVAEYVLIGRTAHLGWLARESAADRRIAADALRRLDLAAFADRDVGSLSGGERQRVVIARALAQESPVLLLDEPTSALDIGHQTGVLEQVDQLRRDDGLSVLAVMHDLTTAASFADRLALMHRGRLIAVGDPDQVMTADRLSTTYDTPLTVRRIDGALVVLPAARRSSPPVSPGPSQELT